MDANITLVPGVEVFTETELLRLAAEHKGVELHCHEGKWSDQSRSIKGYVLDEALLALLKEKGIKREPRPDQVFTLVDENPQEHRPGWSPSNYWNFKIPEGGDGRYDLRIELGCKLLIDSQERGVVFWPNAHGTFLSPADHLPQIRMLRALVENDEEAPTILKALAESEGTIVVFWADLGLGGIKTVSDLFFEFSRGRDEVQRLAHQHRIYSPDPQMSTNIGAERIYIAEPAQPRVLKAWKAQLAAYRAKLDVA